MKENIQENTFYCCSTTPCLIEDNITINCMNGTVLPYDQGSLKYEMILSFLRGHSYTMWSARGGSRNYHN